MAASTARADLRAACAAILTTYQAANPTLLAHVYDHRPGSYRTPCAFVDNVILAPSIDHDSGTRRGELIARVFIVNKLVSNQQAAHEQDVLVDALTDAFTNNPWVTANRSFLEPISVDADVVTEGDASFAASVINVRMREKVGRI